MKKSFLLYGIIVLIALIAAKFLFFSSTKENQKNASGKSLPNIKVYITKQFNLSDVLTIPATILAYDEVTIRPEISGKIIQLNIKEGALVNKGDIIVKIYDKDLQAQLLKLNAQLKLYKENEKRFKELLAIKGISQEQYDQAVSQVEQTEADIQLIQAQIEKTEIKSPINGIISLKNITEGNFVTSADIIANIQSTEMVKLDFDIPEKYADKVHNGDSIEFSVEYLDQHLKAVVFAINNKIDENTRTLKIRSAYQNKRHLVIPGSYANVHLKLTSSRSKMVPLTSILSDIRGSKVYLIKNGALAFAPVQVGIQNDSMIEIISGINIGDTVVFEGTMGVRPGDKYKITSIK